MKTDKIESVINSVSQLKEPIELKIGTIVKLNGVIMQVTDLILNDPFSDEPPTTEIKCRYIGFITKT